MFWFVALLFHCDPLNQSGVLDGKWQKLPLANRAEAGLRELNESAGSRLRAEVGTPGGGAAADIARTGSQEKSGWAGAVHTAAAGPAAVSESDS